MDPVFFLAVTSVDMELVSSWDYTDSLHTPLPAELCDLDDVPIEGALTASLPLLIDPEPIVAPLHVPPPPSPAAYKRWVHNASERERRATLARLLRELGHTVGVGPDQPLIEVIRAAITLAKLSLIRDHRISSPNPVMVAPTIRGVFDPDPTRILGR